MKKRVRTHLAVVVSASAKTDALRCRLLEADLPPAGITSHLHGLRRALVLGEVDRVTLCIALDDATLARHSEELRRLIDDQRNFASTITAIGLTLGEPLTAHAASLGCSVYLDDLSQVVEAVNYFEHCGTLRAPKRNVAGITEYWADAPPEESATQPPDGTSKGKRPKGQRGMRSRRFSDTARDE